MPVHAETQTIELEEEDRTQTAIIGLRYTGRQSTAPPRRPRDSGGWPGRSTFQGGAVAERDGDGNIVAREPGPIQVGINPDWIDEETVEGGTLAGLESLSDFEVIYDPQRIASALLEENYLPPIVFGGDRTAPDYDIRERVLEFLDVPKRLGTADSPDAEQAIREALAKTAGIDTEVEEPPDISRQQEYEAEYSRNDLLSAAKAFAWSDDVNLRTAGKTELAERLAEESPGDVREALDADDPAALRDDTSAE